MALTFFLSKHLKQGEILCLFKQYRIHNKNTWKRLLYDNASCKGEQKEILRKKNLKVEKS